MLNNRRNTRDLGSKHCRFKHKDKKCLAKAIKRVLVAPKLDSTVPYMHLSIDHGSNVKRPVM